MKTTEFNVLNTFSDDGNLNMLEDTDAINQGLKTLLLTNQLELFGDPNFGSIFNSLTYTQLTDVVKDILSDNLYSMIKAYDNRVTIKNITFEMLETSIIIYIGYILNEKESTASITIGG